MGVMENIGDLAKASASEYLTFRLDREEYCIDILKVREIRGYEQPTRIANAPPFIRGVVNLRGTIVPIVDLRMKFGCDNADYNDFTVVVILALEERIVGIVVDSVSDVLRLEPQDIREAPAIDEVVDASCITGLASIGERMLILVDIEKLMAATDMGLASA